MTNDTPTQRLVAAARRMVWNDQPTKAMHADLEEALSLIDQQSGNVDFDPAAILREWAETTRRDVVDVAERFPRLVLDGYDASEVLSYAARAHLLARRLRTELECEVGESIDVLAGDPQEVSR